MGSVNNDWSNWVVLHGNGAVAVEDIWGIGKAIGVSFKGENHNMFSVLSRAKKVNNGHYTQAKGGGGGTVEKGV